MASREHYDILRKQEAAWKEWLRSNTTVNPQRLMYLPQAELDVLEESVFYLESLEEKES